MVNRTSPIGAGRALQAALAWLVTAFALMGCYSTDVYWQHLRVAPGYRSPRDITFQVLESPPGEVRVALELALVDEFAEYKVHATPLDDPNANPTLRVKVEKWDPTAAINLGMVGLVVGLDGQIVLNVSSKNEQGGTGIDGEACGFFEPRRPQDVIHPIAKLIAYMVITGSVGPEHVSPTHSGYPG